MCHGDQTIAAKARREGNDIWQMLTVKTDLMATWSGAISDLCFRSVHVEIGKEFQYSQTY